nr:hypothetical protein [Candidatus Enterousia merdequi]
MSMMKEGQITYKVILQSVQDDDVLEEKCIIVKDKNIFQSIEDLIKAQNGLDKYKQERQGLRGSR